MWTLLYLLVSAICSSSIVAQDPKARFLSLFHIVQFNNERCWTEDGTNEPVGICYSEDECNRKSSKEGGNCAAGFGKCCIVRKWEDDSEVDEPISYFQNEDFPTETSPETGTRVLTVFVTNGDICQVRIDFDDFSLAPPSLTGECEDQSITIEDSIQLCGNNKGQNYIVHVDKVPFSFDILMNVNNEASISYSHSLRITQIDCATNNQYMMDLRAPQGCTQYFNETFGTLSSFNYDGVNMYSENQDYAICIKKSKHSCGIRYSSPPSETGKDRSIGNWKIDEALLQAFPGCQEVDFGSSGRSGCGDTCLVVTDLRGNVMGDFLTIAQGQLTGVKFTDYSSSKSYRSHYCGSGLGLETIGAATEFGGVRDYSGGPFVVHFHTDGNNEATKEFNATGIPGKQLNNLGFVINYSIQAGRCAK